MKVFEIISYNRKDIRFKDNQTFLDTLLKSFDLSYSDMAFCFSFDEGTHCDKAIHFFPKLRPYKKYYAESERYNQSSPSYDFTSIREDQDGNIQIHVKEEHKADVTRLLQKIPRPINFGFVGVVLDRVNWYGDEPQNSVFYTPSGCRSLPSFTFNTYYSNSIRFFKEFDYGNRYNIIKVMIDRTSGADSLRPYPEAFQKVMEELGKPISKEWECVFEPEEMAVWRQADSIVQGMLTKEDVTGNFSEIPEPSLQVQEEAVAYITPVKGFSPKDGFRKAARKYGFQYVSYSNGNYKFQKLNKNNHAFEVEISLIPFSSVFDASVSTAGYNFGFLLSYMPRATIKNAMDAERYAEETFKVASKIEEKCAEKMLAVYGKTPDWYVKKK